VLVAHDPTLEVGRVDLLYERDGWLCAAFRLRDDPLGKTAAEGTKVGTPVSIGAKIHRAAGIDFSFLQEISLVPQAAYAGAEVTSLISMPRFPLATWPPIERKGSETTVGSSPPPRRPPPPIAPAARSSTAARSSAATSARCSASDETTGRRNPCIHAVFKGTQDDYPRTGKSLPDLRGR
jgi:hypothetical protein